MAFKLGSSTGAKALVFLALNVAAKAATHKDQEQNRFKYDF
jgi:hypothetical protein